MSKKKLIKELNQQAQEQLKHTLLLYEVANAPSFLLSISWPWLHNMLGKYYGGKVRKKLRNLNLFLRKRKILNAFSRQPSNDRNNGS